MSVKLAKVLNIARGSVGDITIFIVCAVYRPSKGESLNEVKIDITICFAK